MMKSFQTTALLIMMGFCLFKGIVCPLCAVSTKVGLGIKFCKGSCAYDMYGFRWNSAFCEPQRKDGCRGILIYTICDCTKDLCNWPSSLAPRPENEYLNTKGMELLHV